MEDLAGFFILYFYLYEGGLGITSDIFLSGGLGISICCVRKNVTPP